MKANAGFSGRQARDLISGIRPRLGFGCAELYGGYRRNQSRRIVEAALDEGMTYFDTARLYGHGEAEHILGEVVPRHRDRIILASKAGILPTTITPIRKVEARARRLLRRLPGASNLIEVPRTYEPEFGVFDPRRLRLSVEASLRALRTDHLDILLLHECTAADATDTAVQELLRRLGQEGKIGAWGTATDIATTRSLADKGGLDTPVLQFRDSVWEPNAQSLQSVSTSALVTHSVFGPPFRTFVQRLAAGGVLCAEVARLGVEPSDVMGLARLLLRDALSRNTNGVVLFSTSKPEHLRSNLKAASVDPELAASLAELAR
jgi:aryl-alcohol dehydrogenase-like predicted oxidoreductase